MGKEIVMFGDIEIEKGKFQHRKNLVVRRCGYWKSTGMQYGFFRRKKVINMVLVTKMMIL